MKRSDEILKLTNKIYRAMEKGDEEFIRSMWSTEQGVVAIGTDPEEWWKGADMIGSIFVKQLREMKDLKIKSTNPEAYEESGIGWLADNALMELGGNEIPIRLTGVFHKKENQWKVVQWHASMGIPNEDALGEELPKE